MNNNIKSNKYKNNLRSCISKIYIVNISQKHMMKLELNLNIIVK